MRVDLRGNVVQGWQGMAGDGKGGREGWIGPSPVPAGHTLDDGADCVFVVVAAKPVGGVVLLREVLDDLHKGEGKDARDSPDGALRKNREGLPPSSGSSTGEEVGGADGIQVPQWAAETTRSSLGWAVSP